MIAAFVLIALFAALVLRGIPAPGSHPFHSIELGQ
jgi:hypothetical protein